MRKPVGTLVCLAMMCLLVGSAPAVAQGTSFDTVRGHLVVGETIYVTDAAGRTMKGQFAGLSAESIHLLIDGRPIEMRGPDVQRIVEKRKDSVWNGLLIGAAAGVGVAIAAKESLCSDDSECAAIVMMAIGLPAVAAGTTIGTIADALVQKRVVLYEAPRQDRRITLAPQIGAGGAGLAVRVRF